jgi:hypothetical protein
MLAAPRAGCRRPRHALKIIGMRRRLAASWARTGHCGSAVGIAAAAGIEPGGCSTLEDDDEHQAGGQIFAWPSN